MNQQNLPDAPSTARNREPIAQHLQRLLKPCRKVLEVGSGTGQHAVYFARQLSHLSWQTSELPQNLDGIRTWRATQPAANLPPPIVLDVAAKWPQFKVDAVFTANTLHIMSVDLVGNFFSKLPLVLAPGSLLLVYGPVKIAGEYIGSSNSAFNLWLQDRDPLSGIRDLEWLDQLALKAGLIRIENNFLPSNNQLLVWQMQPHSDDTLSRALW
ncbi:MAG: DUF938 domain-containing protein [Gammaproteobacteria bacterium]|nr:DUF938 domain-containing protein [Gammaproteobacteria bacterium]